MNWEVSFTKQTAKKARNLDESVIAVLQVLIENLRLNGPAPGKHWPNYGKLRGKKNQDQRHCHLIKGNPTYVCCWEVHKTERKIEVYYVGTHEKAPY